MPSRAVVEVAGRNVVLAFSDRSDGDFAISGEPRALARRRSALAPHAWTWLDQVHGAGVVVVSTPGQWAGARADASVTSVPGAVLAVQTADCAPVLLWGSGPGESASPVIAAVHAGWRGLYEGVVEAAVRCMRDLGAVDLHAELGPCIAPEAYEFSERDLTTMALRFGPDVVGATEQGTAALDLPAAVRVALRSAGVLVETGHWACTATATAGGEPRYHSHRARVDAGRQASAIWIEP